MMGPCFSGASRLTELPWPLVWDLVVLEKQTSARGFRAQTAGSAPQKGSCCVGSEIGRAVEIEPLGNSFL